MFFFFLCILYKKICSLIYIYIYFNKNCKLWRTRSTNIIYIMMHIPIVCVLTTVLFLINLYLYFFICLKFIAYFMLIMHMMYSFFKSFKSCLGCVSCFSKDEWMLLLLRDSSHKSYPWSVIEVFKIMNFHFKIWTVEEVLDMFLGVSNKCLMSNT